MALVVGLSATLSRSASAQEATTPEPMPLDALVADAAARYPAILAEWAEVEAMRNREAQVTQPEDPMLMVGVQNLPWRMLSFTEDPMTGLMVGVSQDFYWPGVLDSLGAEARAQVVAMEAEVPEMAFMLWSETVEPYYMIVEADRMATILAERREVLTTLELAATAAYQARMATLTDALRVSAEISRVDLALAEVRRDRRTTVAELNGMLNRPATAPVEVDTTVDPAATARTAEEWLALAIEYRPAFAALSATQEWIAAREDAAEAMDDPMLNATAGWMFRFQEGDAGMDMINLQIGITLPFFSARRTDAMLAELSQTSFAVDRRREELLRALRAEIGVRLEAMDSLRAEIDTLDDELIPTLERTYQSASAHYATSHEGLEPLIEIQDQLLMLQMTRARLLSAYDRQLAALRALSGDSGAIRQISWPTR